jgi:hypothetical protein
MTSCIVKSRKRKNENASKEIHSNSIRSNKQEKEDAKRKKGDCFRNCSRYCYPVKRTEKLDMSAIEPYCFYQTYGEYLKAEALNDYESTQHGRN